MSLICQMLVRKRKCTESVMQVQVVVLLIQRIILFLLVAVGLRVALGK